MSSGKNWTVRAGSGCLPSRSRGNPNARAGLRKQERLVLQTPSALRSEMRNSSSRLVVDQQQRGVARVQRFRNWLRHGVSLSLGLPGPCSHGTDSRAAARQKATSLGPSRTIFPRMCPRAARSCRFLRIRQVVLAVDPDTYGSLIEQGCEVLRAAHHSSGPGWSRP